MQKWADPGIPWKKSKGGEDTLPPQRQNERNLGIATVANIQKTSVLLLGSRCTGKTYTTGLQTRRRGLVAVGTKLIALVELTPGTICKTTNRSHRQSCAIALGNTPIREQTSWAWLEYYGKMPRNNSLPWKASICQHLQQISRTRFRKQSIELQKTGGAEESDNTPEKNSHRGWAVEDLPRWQHSCLPSWLHGLVWQMSTHSLLWRHSLVAGWPRLALSLCSLLCLQVAERCNIEKSRETDLLPAVYLVYVQSCVETRSSWCSGKSNFPIHWNFKQGR